MAQPTTPTNKAAYLLHPKQSPLTVQPSPFPPIPPPPGTLIIHVHATTINPIDRAIQLHGSTFPSFAHLPYPYILGFDIAGTVVSTGLDVTRLKPGDRVVTQCGAWETGDNSRGGFQDYVLVDEHSTALVPEGMKFEDVVVVPLALATAAGGLFGKGFLELDLPSLTPKGKKDEVVLIWGGATSVGACGIQLARAAGYEVVTTSSPHNFSAMKMLGAKEVFDYKCPAVVEDIISYLNDHHKKLAGSLALSNHWLPSLHDAGEACVFIASRCQSAVVGRRKFVATGGPAPAEEKMPDGVGARFIETGAFDTELRERIWGGWVGGALKEGKFVPAPPPIVVETVGLEGLQEGIKKLGEGVSFGKVVVRLVEG